jgi:hypothetical protein
MNNYKRRFNHPSGMRKKNEILRLRKEFGFEGYAFYLITLEMIADAVDNLLPLDELLKEHASIGLSFSYAEFVNLSCDLKLLSYKDELKITSHFVKFKNKKRENKRLFNTNVKHWYEIRGIVFNRDNFTCSYCGRRGGFLELDHIYPFCKGGSDDLDNLTTSCRKCNRQKKDKSLDDFYAWRVGK